jgi:hypothetical protein
MDTIAFPYLFWVLGVLPAFGIISLDYVRKNKYTAKKKRYLIGILYQTGLFVLTLAAANAEKIVLFPRKAPVPYSLDLCRSLHDSSFRMDEIPIAWDRYGRKAAPPPISS